MKKALAGVLAAGAVAVTMFGTAGTASAHCTVNVGRCSAGHCQVNVGTCSDGGECVVTVGRCDNGETDLVAL